MVVTPALTERNEREVWDAVARAYSRLSDAEFEARVRDLDDDDIAEATRMRLRFDVGRFARYCWPDRFELPFNRCHRVLLGDGSAHYKDRRTRKSAIAAPRGLGKSSVSSFAVPVHRVLFGLERFILFLSAEQSLSDDLTSDIFDALTDTEGPLVDLFGPIVVKGGKTDFTVSIGGRPSCRLASKSFGTQVRGKKHQGERPTLIIVDDGERSDRVRSAEQRRVWWRFLHDDVLKAGRKQGGTEVHVRGTVLHPDSMLANLLASAAWDGERFRSILSWPVREDLWERCRRIWCDLTLGDEDRRTAIARAFYQAHKAEMDEGAEVLDAVAEPLFELYMTIWGEGLASFLREKQNEPRDSNSSFFASEKFGRFRVEKGAIVRADGIRVPLDELTVVLRLDPIPGKEIGSIGDEGGAGAGDFAAIAVVARDRWGYCYVLDVWMRRCRDVDMLTAMFTLGEQWRATRASIESNGFQRLITRNFRRMQEERRQAGLWYQLGVQEDNSSESKEDRIASLEPATANGWLLFNEAIPREVLQQFDDFPSGQNDDAPDAVEGAWRLLGKTAVRLSQTPLGARVTGRR